MTEAAPQAHCGNEVAKHRLRKLQAQVISKYLEVKKY
jgi:hypothetical protein